jgi:hypothetical protein
MVIWHHQLNTDTLIGRDLEDVDLCECTTNLMTANHRIIGSTCTDADINISTIVEERAVTGNMYSGRLG